VGQEKLVKSLRDHLAKGDVLVVAGTGVSIQASGGDKRAGWDGLIHNGIDHCVGTGLLTEDEANGLRDQLALNDATQRLEVAGRVSAALEAPNGEFRLWLQENIGALPLHDPDIIDAVHTLGASLATTNYDDFLSRGRAISVVTWTDGAAALEILRGDRRGILHFHGYYDEPESVILGIQSYEAILNSVGPQALQRAAVANLTFLFVGCGDGLSDPNFGVLLEWSASVLGKSIYRHYCLCRTGEADALKKRHTSAKRLSFIEYGDKYSDLEPFLRDLAPKRQHASSLPPAGYCFGRTNEVKDLVSALLKKKPRPIPILGGPGMGKTTIALTSLHDKRVAKRFGDRRWFVRCDGVKTRTELAASIARTLGLPITPNLEPAVLDALCEAPGVLVLDNAETPLDAETAQIEELLSVIGTMETLALAVTIRGHQRPLGVSWAPTIEPSRLAEKAAREAFVAAAGKKEFEKDPYLTRLLDVLDGVPLAITLMANFAQLFDSLELVWERWNTKRTAMLKDGIADRLHDIAVSYELSIGVLLPKARQLLSVLAMLPDGVAHIDLAGVFVDPDDAADELRRRAVVVDEEKRLRMRAPLREYVATAYPPEVADDARAVSYYLTLAATEGKKVGRAGGAEAIARLAPEVANMETMIIRAPEGQHEPITSAVYGWGEIMRFTGLGSSSAIERVMDQAIAAGINEQASRCMSTLADVALDRSDYDTARRLYEQALPLYQKVANLLGEGHCIRSLGEIALRRSDHETAAQQFEQALPLYQKVGAVIGEANCIRSLGEIALRRSDYQTARQRFEQALPLYQRVGSLLGEANCIRSLGDIDLNQSDYETAGQRFDQALPLYQKAGDLLGEANCIQGLGNIANRRSDHETAQQRFEQALPLYQKVGDLHGEANCIQSLGDIAHASGNPDDANSGYREALALHERIQDPFAIAGTHRRLARLAAEGDAKKSHVAAAREAWRSIKRDDLVADLDKEFGPEE
jgi:tetratricopeptide (TPR) repeat protein